MADPAVVGMAVTVVGSGGLAVTLVGPQGGELIFSGAITFSGGVTVSGGTLDMSANRILNIGNAGTDFLSNGGLTLANALTVTTGGLTVSGGNVSIAAGSVTIKQPTDSNVSFQIRNAADDATPFFVRGNGATTIAGSTGGLTISVGGALVTSSILTLGAGVANRSVTSPTNALNIFNGTAPSGTLTNGVTLYSASGELTVMDAAGNATPLSPHHDLESGEPGKEWTFHSENSVTGRVLHIRMEAFVKAVCDRLGMDFVEDFIDAR